MPGKWLNLQKKEVFYDHKLPYIKIKEWKEKRLRKKIILRLLVNRNHNPDGNRTAFEADNIIRYIKSGLPYSVE